ncbi:MAG: PDGLE domain-containing protein [Candidatus Omnitrophota bacterium]
MKTTSKLWIGIGILIFLSPLGLMLPELFKTGDAWGEWGLDAIRELTGYIPQGLEKLSSLWRAPLPDYTFVGWEEKGLPSLSLAYIISAITGIAIVAVVMALIGRMLGLKKDK